MIDHIPFRQFVIPLVAIRLKMLRTKHVENQTCQMLCRQYTSFLGWWSLNTLVEKLILLYLTCSCAKRHKTKVNGALTVWPFMAWYDCPRHELPEHSLSQALPSRELSKLANKTLKKTSANMNSTLINYFPSFSFAHNISSSLVLS